MTNLIADLKNDNNWRQAYQDERSVVFDEAGGYSPLPAFEIPITFDSHLLAVRTLSNNAKFTWRFSGVLSHLFELGNALNANLAIILSKAVLSKAQASVSKPQAALPIFS